MAKPWGSIGAWALDAELAEAEERERVAEAPPSNPTLNGDLSKRFPSLVESAASMKQGKKKKKPVAVPLAQFVASSSRDVSFESKGLTPDEMLRLPTGPRERSQEELSHGRLGGFRSYGDGGGRSRGGFPSRRDGESDGSWGGGRRGFAGFEEEQRRAPPARVLEFDMSSSADEVDNWVAVKKQSVPPRTDTGRRDSYSFRGVDSSSRSDEVDNWSEKKSLPSKNPTFGSEFSDSRTLSESDRWGKSREGSIPTEQGRPGLVLDPPKRDAGAPIEPARSRASPFGAARPREEVLAEKKGLDWRQMDSENEMKSTSRPTSSHSSRPPSSQSSKQVNLGVQSSAVAAEVTVKPKPKVNPFGNAKPREILLQEKGIDWRKVDLELEHRRVERSETNEERLLKEEISNLKSLATASKSHQNGNFTNLSPEELSRVYEKITMKEKDLESLVHQLDDTIRFGQKVAANSRPGSAGGKSDTSSTRPPSQSGMSEGSRSIEFVDGPQSSSGAGDAWVKPIDGRCRFRRGKDKGFFDKTNGGRSSASERW